MWKLGEFCGTSAHFSTHFEASETVHYTFLCLLRLSHDLQTFLNVLMHVDIFSGIYTSQGSGVILVRMCGSLGEFRGTSAHFSTHFEARKTVHYALLCLLRLSYDLQTFLNVLMHVDIFRGMYTSQGSGDILVRMCGSWKNFVVHLRTFRRILKQMKQCIMPFYAFCASHTTCRLF